MTSDDTPPPPSWEQAPPPAGPEPDGPARPARPRIAEERRAATTRRWGIVAVVFAVVAFAFSALVDRGTTSDPNPFDDLASDGTPIGPDEGVTIDPTAEDPSAEEAVGSGTDQPVDEGEGTEAGDDTDEDAPDGEGVGQDEGAARGPSEEPVDGEVLTSVLLTTEDVGLAEVEVQDRPWGEPARSCERTIDAISVADERSAGWADDEGRTVAHELARTDEESAATFVAQHQLAALTCTSEVLTVPLPDGRDGWLLQGTLEDGVGGVVVVRSWMEHRDGIISVLTLRDASTLGAPLPDELLELGAVAGERLASAG